MQPWRPPWRPSASRPSRPPARRRSPSGWPTAPAAQGQGLATRLLRTVIETSRTHGRRGLVLTCLDDLVPFYARLGFIDEGLSTSNHGGVPWHQMRLTLA